jgi:hypothetical protein
MTEPTVAGVREKYAERCQTLIETAGRFADLDVLTLWDAPPYLKAELRELGLQLQAQAFQIAHVVEIAMDDYCEGCGRHKDEHHHPQCPRR